MKRGQRDNSKVADEGHRFNGKMLAWPYCTRCGLVYLKNDFTEWAVRIGCDYKEHPQYEAKRLEFTALGKA